MNEHAMCVCVCVCHGPKVESNLDTSAHLQ